MMEIVILRIVLMEFVAILLVTTKSVKLAGRYLLPVKDIVVMCIVVAKTHEIIVPPPRLLQLVLVRVQIAMVRDMLVAFWPPEKLRSLPVRDVLVQVMTRTILRKASKMRKALIYATRHTMLATGQVIAPLRQARSLLTARGIRWRPPQPRARLGA